jgi:nitroreductase
MRGVGSVLDVLATRRSVRDFEPGAIPDEDVQKILEAGRMAPSPGNSQPWRFHVFRGEAKSRLVESLKSSDAVPLPWRELVLNGMETVPVVIAVENPSVNLGLRTKAAGDAGSRGDGAASGRPLDHLDVASVGSLLGTAAAVENMLLAIHALGYGSVWMGLPSILASVKRVVDASGEIISVLPVGHPADVQHDYVNRTRKPLAELARFHS